MTVVAKASAYPKSVQSGLPRLGACPLGWTRGPLSAHLIEELRPLNMADDEVYDLVTVKRSRGGVVLRERLKGSQIAVKSQFRLKAGDFLISKRQIVHGACGIVPPELDGNIVSNEYSVLRARPSLDLNFLNCLAHSIYFQQTCFHSSIGVHVEKMIFKLDQWMKWDFDLPPLAEQRRIAEILSTWDRAIETAEALVANARALKAALMQGLLTGKQRVAGFGEAWKEVELREVAKVTSGGTPDRNRPEFWGGDIPWVTTSEIGDGPIVSTEQFITSEGLRASAAKIFPAGTLLMAMYGQGATRGKVSHLSISSTTNQACAAIIPNRQVMAEFMFQNLSDRYFEIRNLSNSGSQKNLSLEIIKNIKVLLPPLAEQKCIADILGAWELSVETGTRLIASTRVQKVALMQQLLAGKRRVAVVESEAA